MIINIEDIDYICRCATRVLGKKDGDQCFEIKMYNEDVDISGAEIRCYGTKRLFIKQSLTAGRIVYLQGFEDNVLNNLTKLNKILSATHLRYEITDEWVLIREAMHRYREKHHQLYECLSELCLMLYGNKPFEIEMYNNLGRVIDCIPDYKVLGRMSSASTSYYVTTDWNVVRVLEPIN